MCTVAINSNKTPQISYNEFLGEVLILLFLVIMNLHFDFFCYKRNLLCICHLAFFILQLIYDTIKSNNSGVSGFDDCLHFFPPDLFSGRYLTLLPEWGLFSLSFYWTNLQLLFYIAKIWIMDWRRRNVGRAIRKNACISKITGASTSENRWSYCSCIKLYSGQVFIIEYFDIDVIRYSCRA